MTKTKRSSPKQTANERYLLACENADVALAMQMLAEGAEHDYHNDMGETALHLAVKSGSLKMVEFVVNRTRLSPNIKDTFGRTPLHWGAQTGNLEICEALLLAHANVSAKDDMGMEPKIYAEMGAHHKLVKMFSMVRNARM